MHPLRTARSAHVDRIVLHEQILPLDQFHAHLLGKESMLEIRRVVGPRRQHRDLRLFLSGRRHTAQVFQQQIGVVFDRLDRLRGEQLRKQTHHHLAVFEHVRDTRRHAKVVFEHVVFALACAHDVDTRDVGVDATGHIHALHLAPILRVPENAVLRQDSCLQDGVIVIDVVQEQVQRTHALLEALLQRAPLRRRNDARNDVERDEALGAAILTVNRKSDAHPMERAFRFIALLRDLCGWRAL